jgi:hypothetical protein
MTLTIKVPQCLKNYGAIFHPEAAVLMAYAILLVSFQPVMALRAGYWMNL